MPTPATIENALRTPNRFAPGVKRLGGGTIARRSDGSLALIVGSDAVVARLEQPTGRTIALRVPYKRLLWDAQQMRFTNSDEANALIRRERYREAWDLFG